MNLDIHIQCQISRILDITSKNVTILQHRIQIKNLLVDMKIQSGLIESAMIFSATFLSISQRSRFFPRVLFFFSKFIYVVVFENTKY